MPWEGKEGGRKAKMGRKEILQEKILQRLRVPPRIRGMSEHIGKSLGTVINPLLEICPNAGSGTVKTLRKFKSP